MSEDWKNTQNSASRDLKADGMAFAIRRPFPGKFDPIIGVYEACPEEELQEFTAYGIFKSIGGSSLASSAYNFAWQAGTTIERGDKILLVDCSEYRPQAEDRVMLADGPWLVKSWSVVEPGGTPLIQYLLIRKV